MTTWISASPTSRVRSRSRVLATTVVTSPSLWEITRHIMGTSASEGTVVGGPPTTTVSSSGRVPGSLNTTLEPSAKILITT